MPETPIAADLVVEAAPPLPPFTPAPIPKSGYADPTKVHKKVPFANPVVFEGKTYSSVYLRKLTVGQVRVCVNNAVEMNKRDLNAELILPIYVDEKENDIPDGVIDLLPDDEWQSIREMGRDCIPQRFRPPPETIQTPSSESGASSGETTEE